MNGASKQKELLGKERCSANEQSEWCEETPIKDAIVCDQKRAHRERYQFLVAITAASFPVYIALTLNSMNHPTRELARSQSERWRANERTQRATEWPERIVRRFAPEDTKNPFDLRGKDNSSGSFYLATIQWMGNSVDGQPLPLPTTGLNSDQPRNTVTKKSKS